MGTRMENKSQSGKSNSSSRITNTGEIIHSFFLIWFFIANFSFLTKSIDVTDRQQNRWPRESVARPIGIYKYMFYWSARGCPSEKWIHIFWNISCHKC